MMDSGNSYWVIDDSAVEWMSQFCLQIKDIAQ